MALVQSGGVSGHEASDGSAEGVRTHGGQEADAPPGAEGAVLEPHLAALRRATRRLHERVEEALQLLLDPGLSLRQYRGIVASFYGFYAPIEERLASVPGWPVIGIDLEVRKKTPLLRRDLQALGLAEPEIEGLPRCGSLPAAETPAEAMGCLYVIEGATLGGQVIHKHLARNLAIHAACGGAFFAGYGAETGAMWKAFLEALARVPASGACQSAIVDAACATFLCFEDWMRRRRIG